MAKFLRPAFFYRTPLVAASQHSVMLDDSPAFRPVISHFAKGWSFAAFVEHFKAVTPRRPH